MSNFNEDEVNAPSWMTESFFKTVLSQHENEDDIEIVKFNLSPASMKGDHYASVMFRAKVDYKYSPGSKTVTKSLVIKTIPEAEGFKRDMLMDMSVFETEIKMYVETLPKFEAILAEHGDPTEFAPKIIYHSLAPHKLIVFEDICVRGYDTLRERPLNENEVKAVYRKLAKLHAVSYMLGQSELEHEQVTKYKDGILSASKMLTYESITKGITYFIELIETHDDLSIYVPKLKAIEKDLVRSCMALYRTNQRVFNNEEIMVLNHGDYHMKNLMFKFHKKTTLEDFLMVDFQMCVYAPSILDLTYSVYMLLNSEMRQKRDDFLHYYWENFIETLELIKYEGKMPKFADLKIASLKYRDFAIFMLTTFLPFNIGFIGLTPEEAKDFDAGEVIENDGGTAVLYKNAIYLKEVKRLLPQFLLEGYLD